MKKIPLRTCVACRTNKEKNKLVRIVRLTDGNAVIDLSGRQNGRGAYICLEEQCLKKCIKSKVLEKQLEIHIEDQLYKQLEEIITSRRNNN